jgi:hypothetical protein
LNVPSRRPRVLPAVLSAAVLLLPASFAGAHPNARFYRGDIVLSTSWEGIVRLTGTVVVREGVTVTVEPGTEILVQPDPGADIVVKGRFLVRGIPSRPVLFDTAGGCKAGPWGGVRFEPGSVGILENAVVHCSSKGISGDMKGVTKTNLKVETTK